MERQALAAPRGDDPPRTAVQSAQQWVTSCQGRLDRAQAPLAQATTRLLVASQQLQAAQGVTVAGRVRCALPRDTPDWQRLSQAALDAEQCYHAARLEDTRAQEEAAQARQALDSATAQAIATARRQAARREHPALFADLERAVARLEQLQPDRYGNAHPQYAREHWIVQDLQTKGDF